VIDHHFNATMNTEPLSNLIQGILEKDKRALARAISLVENQDAQADGLLTALYGRTGQAYLVGITGAPGTGKSTLVNQIARRYRTQGTRVGILAVDPSSPFTGGALLGDRIRMQDLAGDPGVFIRSMATRGALGGLSAATFDAALILDAAGYETILIETVGAGQNEVDIARLADTVIVVEAPGLGDEVQAGKAGLAEIADIWVVNKADREGADRTASLIEAMLELAPPADWLPPVCKTVATLGNGVDEVVTQIERHRQYLHAHHKRQIKVKIRAEQRLKEQLQAALLERCLAKIEPEQWQNILDRLVARQITPHHALSMLIEN